MEKTCEEEFYIDFMIRGRNYTGLVTVMNQEMLSTFVIRYSMAPSHQFEQTIELYPVVSKETEPLEWQEMLSEDGKEPGDRSLIRIIGEALEERDL